VFIVVFVLIGSLKSKKRIKGSTGWICIYPEYPKIQKILIQTRNAVIKDVEDERINRMDLHLS